MMDNKIAATRDVLVSIRIEASDSCQFLRQERDMLIHHRSKLQVVCDLAIDGGARDMDTEREIAAINLTIYEKERRIRANLGLVMAVDHIATHLRII